MKASTALLLVGWAATRAFCYPGLSRAMAELQGLEGGQSSLGKRSTEVIGDLASMPDDALTPSGTAIKEILAGGSANADSTTYTPPGDFLSATCQRILLCVWHWVVVELRAAFRDDAGCTALARGAIRQGFHDAATWDRDSAYGGADGSLLLNDEELARQDNMGLAEIAAQTRAWHAKFAPYGVGMADLIQTAALVATVSCPGGPRIRAFVGRRDDARPGPAGRLPLPFQDAPELLALFAAKTFTPGDLVALLGAHSASAQRFVDPARAGTPQDSTPARWDTRYYGETLAGDNSTILIFHSDSSIAAYAETRARFRQFAAVGGQILWNPAYAQAYFRMSMLGVTNLNNLTEITWVLPLAQ
ncbi:putative class II peroxidase [Durotheca rogersii]|uniref:putative class II peroxidase n=1 Tax=Durotheca rogersii TaxID=419775 RepID=UPI00221FCD7F|nr:putative class II peroxidase [Durotheca rogersii]KAI5861470.1 putative class II peroxidase [Durotheca rogersii]